MCAGGCTRALAVVFLLLAAVASAVHFISPYWMQAEGYNYGLWAVCLAPLDFSKFQQSLDACVWFSDNKFELLKQAEAWQHACQGLSGFGIVFLLLAVPTGCGSLCCCKSDRLASFTGVTTIFACLLQAASIAVWGYFAHEKKDVMPFVNGSMSQAEWGYYLGIGAVIVGLVAGGLFLCSRSKSRY